MMKIVIKLIKNQNPMIQFNVVVVAVDSPQEIYVVRITLEHSVVWASHTAPQMHKSLLRQCTIYIYI